MEKTRKENSLFVRRTWQRVLAIVLSVFMALSFTPAPAVHAASNNMVTQDELTFGTAGKASFTTDEYTDQYSEYNKIHIYKGDTQVDANFKSSELERKDIQIANVYINTKSDTPAGDYTFKFYKIEGQTEVVCDYFVGNFTIDPMPVTISLKEGVEKITKEYSDVMDSDTYKSNLTFTYTADSTFTTALNNLEFTSGAFATSAAPSDVAYAVTKSDSVHNTDYYIVNDIPGVTVEKKPLSKLSLTVTDVVYKGAAYAIGDLTKIWKKGENIVNLGANDVSYKFDDNVTVLNAGTYNITATATADSYYTGSKTTTFKVTPKAITSDGIIVTVSENTKTYNKGQQSPKVVVKDGETVLVKETDYTVTNYVQTNANTYDLTISGKGNYGSTKSLTEKFVINRANITEVTINAVGNWTYGDKEEAITPSVNGWDTTLYPGTSVSYKYKKIKNSDGNDISNPTTVDIVGSIPKNLAAGTYQLWAEIDDATDSGNDNYNKATLDPVTFVISAKPVNITLGNIEKFYGDSITSADYTFTINTPAYEDKPVFAGLNAAGMKNTDNDYGGAVVIDGDASPHAEVGNYSADGNYRINSITNGTVTRNPISFATDTTRATISLSAASFVYNGSAQQPTVTFTVKKGAGTETLTKDTDYEVGIYASQDATNTVTPINAGTYYVKVSAKAGSGKITGVKWIPFTITKAELTLTYTTINGIYYPNTTEYDMSAYTPTVKIGGHVVDNPTFASLLADNMHVVSKTNNSYGGAGKPLKFGYMYNGSFVEYSATNNALFNEAANNNYTIQFVTSYVDVAKANVSIEVTGMPVSWQYLDTFTLPTINAYVYKDNNKNNAKANVNDQVTFTYYYKKKTNNSWPDGWTTATVDQIKALGVGDYKLRVTTAETQNNLKAGDTTNEYSGSLELPFSVLSKQIDIRIQNSTKKYLNRDVLTYKAYKYVAGTTSQESAWVEMTKAELEKYIVDGKILLGRSDENADAGEDVGAHTIDLYSYTLKDNVEGNVTITKSNGTLTIEPLDLAAEGEGAKLLINVEPETNDNWVMDSNGRMMYLYDGQKHRPQMEERDLQVSWKNSQKQTGVLGYYTQGASGAYHYVLVPEKDYIISFTDEAGNQVSNPTNAGKYFITITNSNGSNNIINSYLVQEFEILPIVYYVDYQNEEGSADVIKKTYDGTATFGEFTVKSAKYGNKDIIDAANDPTKYDYTEVTSGTADWNLLPTTGTSASANAGTYRYDAVDADKKMNIDTSAFEEVYGKKNFKVEVVDSFVIEQKAVTVTPDNASKTYGDADPAEFTYTATGLVGDEELEDIIVTRVKGEDVNDYVITASNTDGKNANYSITCEPGTFTITPKAITVTANNASKSYGAADPALSYTADGLVGREALNDITVKRDAGENAGTYTISVSGNATSNPNYAITYKKGTFTINKAAASTTPSAASIKATKATGSSKDASISGVNSSMEYSTDGGKTWKSVPAGTTSISGLGAGTVLVRTKGDANHNPSNAVSVTIAKKASQTAPSPTAIKANAASTGSSNGTITGVNDTMEYSTNGGKTWKSVPKGATSITGLSAGIVQIRRKATADSAASSAITVVINSRSSLYKSEWRSGQWYDSNGTTSYKPKGSWKKNSTGWWYEDSAGWYPKAQWQKIDGLWYYFNASGYMASSEWVDGYWVDSDGAWRYSARGSWKHDGTGWWFGDTSGWYAKNQWQKIDGTWYYFDGDGHMK